MTSEQEKNLFLQAQAYQQQMQQVMMQKEALNMQSIEIKRAIEELDKTTEADVYKISGTVIVKSPKDAVKKELSDKKAGIDAMLKTLDASEKKIKSKITELRGKFGEEGGEGKA